MTPTYNAFIYIWYNRVKKMFYIGKHSGSINDGYICSSKYMKIDYNRSPHHFKRRVLECLDDTDGNQMLKAELKWLSLIKDEQLGKKYYNLKNKNFGNTRSCTKSYVWNQGLNKAEQKEYLELRKNKLFCLLTEKPKKGMIFRPLMQYICKHCNKVFESKLSRTFCSNKCTSQWSAANGVGEKISKSLQGKPAWNKGLPNAIAAVSGKKGAAKQSATVTGRKLFIRPDGSRTWIYPNKTTPT